MLITTLLISVWALLMLRAGIAEYKYYQSVKKFAPEVWLKLGSGKRRKTPLAFISKHDVALLQEISNRTVQVLANKHQQASKHFLWYVVIVLVVSIVYFKTA